MDCDLNEKMAGQTVITRTFPPAHLTDIIQLPVKNHPLNINSLQADYEAKGLSLRQIADQKVHSRTTIRKNLKGQMSGFVLLVIITATLLN